MKHTKAGFFHPAIALNRLYLVYILRVLNAWNCQQLFSVSNTNRFYRTLCNLWTLLEAECKNDMCAEWNGEYVNRFDSIRYLSCPMQCTRNLGCFPRGNRAGVVRRYPVVVFPELRFVVFLFHRLLSLLFYDRCIWDVSRAHKFECVSYTRRGIRHKQGCIRVDSEGQKNCGWPCPARG